MKEIKISIIIVNYHVEKELLECIESILNSKTRSSIEIIVVDNDEDKTIEKNLKKKFPSIRYVSNSVNNGYSGGNNLGASFAKGEFLFILNPDTLVKPGAVDVLLDILQNQGRVGIVSPLLLDKNQKIYPLQGTKELTPLRAIFSLSFLNKIFPNNKISKNFWTKTWNKSKNKEVDVVPGTALMIRRSIFKKLGGFDENFFLYFEEFDLCKRVKKLGLKIFIVAEAKVIHLWESSTLQRENRMTDFSQSRFYYFKKHYGLLKTILVESVVRINRTTGILLIALLAGLYLRVFRLPETATFFGDQAWFYISARDMLIRGKIPLVGITSSHTWLHQGPFWTYILVFPLYFSNFNPISGVYISIFLDLLFILFIYLIGREIFSKRIAILAAFLAAFSPLMIMQADSPYHTSPIPLLTLFFIYSLSMMIKGKKVFFAISLFILSLLYNFELATVVLFFVLFTYIAILFFYRKPFFKELFNKKNLTLPILAFLAPLTPVIIHDFSSGFNQTVKFTLWIGYKIINFSYSGNFHEGTFNSMIVFFFNNYKKLIIPAPTYLSLAFLILSIIIFIFLLYRNRSKDFMFGKYLFLAVLFIVPFFGFLLNKTDSFAYLPVLFPTIIFLTAIAFDYFFSIKVFKFIIIIIFLFFCLNDVFFIRNLNELANLNIAKKEEAVKVIIKKANRRNFNIVGKGLNSEFNTFIMSYQYLLWWFGNPPSVNNEKLKFYIEETTKGVILTEENKK